MFELLNKYNNKGHFIFNPEDSLSKVCNAPKNSAGVYLVYDITDGIKLIYIGSSGKVLNNGSLKIRKGGIYDRLVNGKQTFKIAGFEIRKERKKIWPLKMKDDNINLIKIDWHVTFDHVNTDIPAYTEALLIQRYFEKNKCLPKWNKEI